MMSQLCSHRHTPARPWVQKHRHGPVRADQSEQTEISEDYTLIRQAVKHSFKKWKEMKAWTWTWAQKLFPLFSNVRSQSWQSYTYNHDYDHVSHHMTVLSPWAYIMFLFFTFGKCVVSSDSRVWIRSGWRRQPQKILPFRQQSSATCESRVRIQSQQRSLCLCFMLTAEGSWLRSVLFIHIFNLSLCRAPLSLWFRILSRFMILSSSWASEV